MLPLPCWSVSVVFPKKPPPTDQLSARPEFLPSKINQSTLNFSKMVSWARTCPKKTSMRASCKRKDAMKSSPVLATALTTTSLTTVSLLNTWSPWTTAILAGFSGLEWAAYIVERKHA